MLEPREINEIVIGQARKFLVRRPDLSQQITTLLFQFSTKLGAIGIQNVTEIFDLCRRVDSELAITPDIAAAIAETRKEIQDLLIHAFYGKERAGLYGDMDGMREISRRENLAKAVAKLVILLRREKQSDAFDQQWIRSKNEALFEELKTLVTDRDTRIQKWQEVKEMLPADIRERFDIKVVMAREKELLIKVEPYKELAKKLGPEAIAEFLVSIGAVREQEFSKVVGILTEYLGKVRVPKPGLDDVPDIPEGILKLPSLKRWLFIRLRNHVYRELLKDGHDSGLAANHVGGLEKIKGRIKQIAAEKLDESCKEHKELLDAVVAYFKEALALKVPDRMVESLVDKQGNTRFVPSLRQRLAMLEIRGTGVALYGMDDKEQQKSRNRRHLVEFFMGQGKTLAAFLGKEFVGAKKALYCCPNVGGGKLVEEIKHRVEEKYYKPGQAPTVGIIRAGMTKQELDAALECEVVIFPYSMFGSSVEDQRIVGAIKEKPFDYMIVDEIHYARKDYGRNTETVFELATGIPGLYENGHIVGLTGNSTPNRPDDIVPQLRLWDKDEFDGITSVRSAVRRAGPVAMRNAVSDYILLVDEPEDWEKYVKTEFIDLYEDERKLYDAILDDESMTLSAKLRALYLCAMNPSLFVPLTNMSSAFLNKVTAKIDEALESHGKVVVAENVFKEGLLRELASSSGTTFVEKIKQHVGGRAEVCVIDGDTPEAERKAIFERSLEPDRKMVIVAMGEIIRVGIDLSHISRCICLNPCWNKPDLAQLVKRFAREGNEDAQISLVIPSNTVLEGILEHSEEKEEENRIFKHGGALTEDDLALLERGDFSEQVVVTRGRVYIGTIIRNATLTDRQKLHRMFDYMAGLGADGMKTFVEQYGEEFARLYVKVWERGYGGNNGRFVAGLWKTLEEKGIIAGARVGDFGCGHLALENAFAAMGDTKPRTIFNLDMNGYMLEAGKAILRERNQASQPLIHNGSFTDMQNLFPDGNFDAINSSMSLYCTQFNEQRKKDLHKDERVHTLLEFNRVLKEGGVMVLTLPIDSCEPQQAENLAKALESHFGFEVLREYSGKAISTDDGEEGNGHFENYTIVCRKVKTPDLTGFDISALKFTRVKKLKKPAARRRAAPHPHDEEKGSWHTAFQINAHGFEFDFGVAEKKRIEREFMDKVAAARICLQGLYEKHDQSLAGFTDNDRGELMLHGITPVNTGDAPGFILESDPVYPKRLWYLEDKPEEPVP